MGLGILLFGKEHRHLSAETLFSEAQRAKVNVSLATIYNCLHAFTEAGLLRTVIVDGQQVIWDTNTSHHHHFVCDQDGSVIDVPAMVIDQSAINGVPDDMDVVDVQVIMRVRPILQRGHRLPQSK
ncbi:Iron-responsive regulator Irr [Methylorubrum populi]|uniref:Ferric uptake regulation protein n=2 Tax=Methylorubrum populi TaxID=223967 RepID=A0A833IZR5_9HYPH|nr:Iron-responsive regulator Irr [Methylorubrum populi]